MREIEFRGKTESGEWTYGYLFMTWERAYLLWGTTNGIPNMTEVIPETVGQYTGLKDKNGKKIYEGDIVKRKEKTCVVVFHDSEFSLKMDDYEYIQHGLLTSAWKDDIEVIGNIHD